MYTNAFVHDKYIIIIIIIKGKNNSLYLHAVDDVNCIEECKTKYTILKQ